MCPHLLSLLFLLLFLSITPSLSDPRSSEAALICGNQTASNGTRQTFITNFLSAMDAVTNQISSSGDARTINGTGNETVFAFGECMKDLSRNDCDLCVAQGKTQFFKCHPFSKLIRSARNYLDGCYLRYDDYDFFGEATSPSDRTVCNVTDFDGNQTAFTANSASLVRNLSSQALKNDGFFVGSVGEGGNSTAYGLAQCWEFVNKSGCAECLADAVTKIRSCFPKKEGRVLNSGCLMMYSTGILPDGKAVAVKRLFFNTRQWVDEFFNEINLTSSVHHKNLVKLLGCSITGPESLLVYEFVPNNSLHYHLSDRRYSEKLSWEMRYDIIVGTAEGLAYLHEESRLRIIHRDIKLSNVLLDENFSVKIADFGLARLFPEDRTHLSTGIAGTFFRSSREPPKKLPLSLLLILSSLTPLATADARARTIYSFCSTTLEDNSTALATNFISEVDRIAEQVRLNGSGLAVLGVSPNRNYVLAQCYGDLSLFDCVLCYTEAHTVLSKCYPFNAGRICLDGCFMRFNSYNFFDEFTGPYDKAVCGNATTAQDGVRFATMVKQVVTSAITVAPLNRACLSNASKAALGCLPGSEGRALYTGCFLRYLNTDFLNAIPDSGHSKGKIIAIVVAIVGAVALVGVGLAVGNAIRKNRIIQKKRKGSNDTVKLASTLYNSSLNFKYSTLESATRSFNLANKIGQGGFASGVLADGREIAVKRLFFNNKHRASNFYNEVNIISSVDHKNLVKLLGCSCSGPESLLVYEFVPNKSLDCFIFDTERGKLLTWEKRFEIIFGTAEGIAYLHENSKTRIIHRDIKVSNIPLDLKLRAKIADFGLARGYMAPEYLPHGQLTEKVDVYSFGVLLMERVWKHFHSQTIEELIESNILLHSDQCRDAIMEDISRVVHVALLCTQENPLLRPAISETLHMLLKKDEQLPMPTKPPFTNEKTMELKGMCEDQCENHNATSSGAATISDTAVYGR
ncbi:Cysteine-rich receptor-like protein kinase 2 [Acorus calamus]|uniref:non-specific serine/threonine protein kinase n=1 Tax=Acorus calamus TaxID=4465 RepID=A0AAV9DMK0_ACOCL|nr:Cysteine-rich receptor-like protein kinase 2 [Acorus calamus]